MKTKYVLVLCGLVVSIFTLTSFKNAPFLDMAEYAIQETMVVNAVYDGHEDYGYNFIATDEEGEEHTITFQKVGADILQAFDLNSAALVGSKFKITYTHEIIVTKDGDGYEDENEVNTITKLEKL
jgi:uncharacterized protein YxeA